MLPFGHVTGTWLVARAFSRRRLDYRALAVAAMLPDLLDKPLAMWVFKGARSSQLAAHSVISHALLLLITWKTWPRLRPYLLASLGHLAADRMWEHPPTFFWPCFGWQSFRNYRPMDTPERMLNVYLDLIRLPQLWLPEVIAVGLWLWFLRREGLDQPDTWLDFLRHGHLPHHPTPPPSETSQCV